MTIRYLLYGFITSALITACGKQHIPADDFEKPAGAATFLNPLLVSGPDPYVAQLDGSYYYSNTMGDRLVIYSAGRLSYLQYAYRKTVWTPPSDTSYSHGISAPKMYLIKDKWYIYFTAYDGIDAHRRIYVIENESEDPLAGTWNFKGQLAASEDKWANGGTILEYKDKRYFIWSGRQEDDDEGRQQLYIAEMTDPWTIQGDRILISEPVYDWEKNIPVNEAPGILKNRDGDVFLVYSAGNCSTDDYCMGMISLKTNGDPLDPQDWVKHPDSLFGTDANSGAYGPGNFGFFKSPDGSEDWMIYDANTGPGEGCGSSRSPRIQRFKWNSNGTPDFGMPLRIDSLIARPSGE